MTVLKIGIILLVIFLGLNYVNPANWSPFAPNGIAGVLKGVSAVFEIDLDRGPGHEVEEGELQGDL